MTSVKRIKVLVALLVCLSGNLVSAGQIPFGFFRGAIAPVVTAALTLVTGALGGPGSADGTGAASRFMSPFGIAIDSSGNRYITDEYNNTIRKMTSAGVVTTLAGRPGYVGAGDGTGSAARFNSPQGIAVDSSGNLYVADSGSHTIRKITSAGVVTTFAGGAGISGAVNATGTSARFNSPMGIAIDSSGNLFVSDYGNSCIRKITSAGVVTTFAGTMGSPGSANGTGAAARFMAPAGITIDGSGNLYVADFGNYTIRKITTGAAVTTIAGTAGTPGTANGTGSAARFMAPFAVGYIAATGKIAIVDVGDSTIRLMTSAGVVTALAGASGVSGSEDGTGTSGTFNTSHGVAADSSGNLFVTDYGSGLIRKVTSVGVVTTIAGSLPATGYSDGALGSAQFGLLTGIVLDSSGNIFAGDYGNTMIRKITSTTVSTLAGGGADPAADGTGTAAGFAGPAGIAIDSNGNLFVTDMLASTIRKVTPSGVVTTLAGSAGQIGATNGTGAAARFSYPFAITVDSSNNIYVGDGTLTVRKVTQAGVVTTFAGTSGVLGSADGTGTAASFGGIAGLAADGSGNIYVADGSHTIRKITSAGVVTTIAGSSGNPGWADGTGTAARFNIGGNTAMTVSPAGNIYVIDQQNYTIRKVTPAGVVTTVVGVLGQGGVVLGALPAQIGQSYGLAASSTTLYIQSENAILKCPLP